ncbi:MAG: adenylosuccinate lyase [Verrucomicrobia bacterium]|mgnify:CR=1 FL=1|nr:adenylosuccinate lyase [Verrucomicrobiota bacterium]OQC66801.1 MAG: Adenylosuccinate lyase [Verrucomicrobia bacterium ADurb.Bin006]MDI9379869.1 adenylosuccinate lyase [Verrucomicrobiota bacterium]NMD18742.1 adenylosuccinate lyase [Verrucomicrobiota bacterium]HNV00741.1 adenylosuccinate lyase [Verrucomicrobiota bacterium]
MITRYSRPAMRGIWTEENKLRIWLQIELLATEALVAEGIVPASDFARIRVGVDRWLGDLEGLVRRQKELEKTLNHDVIGFTTAVAEAIDDPASRWFHFGLTSSDVIDTAFALQMVQSADILIEDVKALRQVLARRAREHQFTPCIGRSHGIHAEPTTFGLKLALMHDEFGRHLRRLESARQTVGVGKLSGAVGTNAHLSPGVETAVCARLGLRPAPIATQVVSRDIHAEFQAALAIVGAGIERWAVEFRHLQRTEVLEAEEPFGKGQKGSSAMPHKRNPITWERLTGLARVLRGNALAAFENVALWHERDISHSSVERIIFPDSCTLLDYMFGLLIRLIEGLNVYPDNMRKNLGLSLGMWNSQTVLLALISKGLTREEAYALVQDAAMKTWEVKHAGRDDADFLAQLKANPAVSSHFEQGELERLCSIDFHLKAVEDRFRTLGL